MPFDSGAYAAKALHPPMHPDIPVENYELAVQPDTPMKLIKIFYGSEKRYFDKMPLPEVLDATKVWSDLEVNAYDQLIRSRSNSKVDDRVSAIEIQIKDEIVLHNMIEAVVIPSGSLESPRVRDQITNWGAIPIPYYLGKEFSPREIVGLIEQKVREFLVQTGCF